MLQENCDLGRASLVPCNEMLQPLLCPEGERAVSAEAESLSVQQVVLQAAEPGGPLLGYKYLQVWPLKDVLDIYQSRERKWP